MPRTNVIVRQSRAISILVVIVLFPFFWLLLRAATLIVMISAVALLSLLWPNLPNAPYPYFEAIGLVVPSLIAIVCSVIFYRDSRRQPISPDGRYCAAFGYDLTGNTSGTCPECGDVV